MAYSFTDIAWLWLDIITMKLLIYFTFLAVSQAEIIADRKCENVVTYNGVQYEKETLVKGFNSPYQLAIDPVTKTLFFSYTTELPGEAFKSVYLNLETKEYDVIQGINGSFAHTVDVDNHIVYLGSSDEGIFKFDYELKKAVPLDTMITNDSIWQMFYKDGVYYTTYPEEKAYLFKNGDVKTIKELEKSKCLLIAVDNKQNIFFSNSSGLFVNKNKNKITTQIGEYILNGFSSDDQGNLYFSTPVGIYSITGEKSVKEVMKVDDVFGFALEGERNIIYSNENSIVRLKPTQTKCKVT